MSNVFDDFHPSALLSTLYLSLQQPLSRAVNVLRRRMNPHKILVQLLIHPLHSSAHIVKICNQSQRINMSSCRMCEEEKTSQRENFPSFYIIFVKLILAK